MTWKEEELNRTPTPLSQSAQQQIILYTDPHLPAQEDWQCLANMKYVFYEKRTWDFWINAEIFYLWGTIRWLLFASVIFEIQEDKCRIGLSHQTINKNRLKLRMHFKNDRKDI